MPRIYACLIFILLFGCQQAAKNADKNAPPSKTVRISGQTMGTTYSIVLLAEELAVLTNEVARTTPREGKGNPVELIIKSVIDSALVALNDEVSNWEKSSTIVRFNQTGTGMNVAGAEHFLANYKIARQAYELTDGAFEPTILPLTDYWGFGSGIERIKAGVDTAEVMRRLALVGMDKMQLEGDTFLRKLEPAVQLDLGGSAKGYGSDLMAKILRDRYGIENALVEIGGEMYAAGNKGPNQPWRVGINLPEETAALNQIAELMPLENRAVATSGNYRNFYKVDGETYSHTLNPKTGFPERNTLLSASVLASSCAQADAFATACMVLGPEKAMELIESQPDVEAYFLVRMDDGEMEARLSSGLKL